MRGPSRAGNDGRRGKVDADTIRVNFGVSWKDRKGRRIRTRNDFIMVPANFTYDEIHNAVKDAVIKRHPNTLLVGWDKHQ